MLIYLLTKQACSLDSLTEKLFPSQSLPKAKFLPLTMEFVQFIASNYVSKLGFTFPEEHCI